MQKKYGDSQEKSYLYICPKENIKKYNNWDSVNRWKKSQLHYSNYPRNTLYLAL